MAVTRNRSALAGRLRARGSALLLQAAVLAVLGLIILASAAGTIHRASVAAGLSRVKSDMQTYAAALEAYEVDHGAYPPNGGPSGLVSTLENALDRLSTPLGYLRDAHLPEPFNDRTGWMLYQGWDLVDAGGPPPQDMRDKAVTLYLYYASPTGPGSGNGGAIGILPGPCVVDGMDYNALSHFTNAKGWMIISPGPDGVFTFDRVYTQNGGELLCAITAQLVEVLPETGRAYDPTNGLVSGGDMVRFRGPSDSAVSFWAEYE